MSSGATETVPPPAGWTAKDATWLATVLGLWVLVSPFVLSGSVGTGTPMWATVVAGVLVIVLPAFGAYAVRSGAETEPNSAPELTGWLAALVGLWILVSPFVLSGSIGSGTPMWSNVIAGVLGAVFAAYAGYEIHASVA